MQPASPVVRGFEQNETTFAEHQAQYHNLPAIRCRDGAVITRWHLSLAERLKVLLSGNVYLHVQTFNGPLPPVFLEVDEPQLAG